MNNNGKKKKQSNKQTKILTSSFSLQPKKNPKNLKIKFL